MHLKNDSSFIYDIISVCKTYFQKCSMLYEFGNIFFNVVLNFCQFVNVQMLFVCINQLHKH